MIREENNINSLLINSLLERCDNFASELSDKFKELNSWTQKLVCDGRFSKLQSSEEIKTLESRLESLDREVAQHQQACAAYDKAIGEQQTKLLSLDQKLQARLNDLEQRNAIFQGGEMMTAQFEKDRQEKQTYSAEDLCKMKEMLSLYNESLSFRVDRSCHDSVESFDFMFTNIDSEDMQKVFSVKAQYNKKTHLISVLDSCPKVADLNLEMILKGKSDWHEFLVTIRELFKRHVK